MTWQPGRDKIARLLDAGELQQVTVDQRIARLLLDDAGRHLATAATARSSGDLSGAYQLAYDALRKSAVSLLATQGLRATSRIRVFCVHRAALPRRSHICRCEGDVPVPDVRHYECVGPHGLSVGIPDNELLCSALGVILVHHQCISGQCSSDVQLVFPLRVARGLEHCIEELVKLVDGFLGERAGETGECGYPVRINTNSSRPNAHEARAQHKAQKCSHPPCRREGR